MSEEIIAQEARKVKPELAERVCCICAAPFMPDDEMQVLCLGCEALGIRCGCVMPWQNCAICRATEALVRGRAA